MADNTTYKSSSFPPTNIQKYSLIRMLSKTFLNQYSKWLVGANPGLLMVTRYTGSSVPVALAYIYTKLILHSSLRGAQGMATTIFRLTESSKMNCEMSPTTYANYRTSSERESRLLERGGGRGIFRYRCRETNITLRHILPHIQGNLS